jgi:hypothetical protein
MLGIADELLDRLGSQEIRIHSPSGDFRVGVLMTAWFAT